jgi:hypothetical protein
VRGAQLISICFSFCRHSNGVVSVKGVDAGAPGYGKVDKGDVIVAVDKMECHGKVDASLFAQTPHFP